MDIAEYDRPDKNKNEIITQMHLLTDAWHGFNSYRRVRAQHPFTDVAYVRTIMSVFLSVKFAIKTQFKNKIYIWGCFSYFFINYLLFGLGEGIYI